MSDIVERLRDAYTAWNNPPSDALPRGAGVMLEAADEIERLREENERHEAAYAEIYRDFRAQNDEIERLRAELAELRQQRRDEEERVFAATKEKNG